MPTDLLLFPEQYYRTTKPTVFDTLPSGLVALTVQLSAVVVVLIDICNCPLFTKVTCAAGTV